MRPRFAATALSLLVSIGILEGASRALFSCDACFRRLQGNDDPSWRLAWVKRGRREGVSYPTDVYHRTRGWALKAGLRDRPFFVSHVLNSNSRGLRGGRDYSYEKPAGTTRLLVFGDSFTFGEEVSDDETYSHRLGEMLPGTEVLNFGVHGYGHDQMLLYLREEGVKYHPDVVILGFLSMDMERNRLRFRDYAKPRFEWVGGRLELRGTPVPAPEQVVAAEFYRSRFWDLLNMLSQRLWVRVQPDSAQAGPLTAAILDEIVRTVRGAGATPVFTYLPAEGEVADRSESATKGERFLMDYCHERTMFCVSVRPRFLAEQSRGAPLKARGHWSAREHLLAAQALRDALVEQRLVGENVER